MLLKEYKRSIKMTDAEEILDLIFYRPIAFLFVKGIYQLPITPNQVTLLSLVAGLIAAWYFALADGTAFVSAALWYALANVLDCSDGQLARLQNSGTHFGRVVDGGVDYISSLAIFLGVGIGMSRSGQEQWWLVSATMISSAIHAIFFDHYQNEYISMVRGEKNFLEREIDRFTTELRKLETSHRYGLQQFVLRLYLRYLNLQKISSTKRGAAMFVPDHYRARNSLMIRLWSFLGPTMNRSTLIGCALAGRVDLYLWAIMIPGNCWMVLCYLLQKRIHRLMEEDAFAEASLEHAQG